MKQLESGDGPTQTRQPLRAVMEEPTIEMSYSKEMRDDAPGRRPEQPPVAPGNLERAPPKRGSFSAELILEFRSFKRKLFAFPIGVTATAQNVIILTDTGNHNVLMFNFEAEPLGQANLPKSLGGFKRPSAVVAQEDGTFAVKDDNCIHVFSKHGEYIRTLGKGVLSRPYGLALEGGENLLTLSLGESPPALRSYRMSGNFETVNTYETLAPQAPSRSKCRFMEVHDKDLFVSDLGLNYIYKTSLQGEPVKLFGGRGRSPGRLNEPSGLCATQEYLFVGDSKNDRIQVFDFDGSFISEVKMPKMFPVVRPSGLYVSPKDTLYVANYLKASVGVYQLFFQEEP